MKCPKCKSENKVKNGIIKQVQGYKCKDCGCNYAIDSQRQEKKRKSDVLLFFAQSFFTNKKRNKMQLKLFYSSVWFS